MSIRAFEALAFLLEYPGPDFKSRLDEVQNDLGDLDGTVLEEARRFLEFAASSAPTDLEELYTRTFDINPVCCQEVGWQIFGEAYDRGGFLVKISAALRYHDIEPTTELGDHLTQMLRLLAHSDPPRARALGRGFLLPAVEKMLGGFADSDSPYAGVLSAVNRAIECRVAEIETEESHA